MTYYGIYKITNLLNGKMYIGQHTTSNIDDGYMGSGLLIERAIKKYGKQNFSKEWLMFCEDEEELNYMERVYVDQTWIDRSDTYNLNLGGNQQHISEQTRKKMSEARKGKSPANKGIPLSEESRRKISEACKGKPHSKEHNQKISESCKGKLRSAEAKQNISKACRGKKHEACRGRPFSDEHRLKLSESCKQYWRKKKESKKYDEMVS